MDPSSEITSEQPRNKKNPSESNEGYIEGLVTIEGGNIVVDSHPGDSAPLLIISADAVRNRDEVEAAARDGRWTSVFLDLTRSGLLAHPVSLQMFWSPALEIRLISDWSYQRILDRFRSDGCSISGCRYHDSGANPANVFYCALNLSDAILRAGYTLPAASNVNYCDQPAHAQPRVRNADGMARIVKAKNGGRIDVSGWANRPTWHGIVYFEGGPDLSAATGHIDLWSGTDAVHKAYPTATVCWFWQLAD